MTYKFRGLEIPDYMEPGIMRYIEKGSIPGDFLQAIIRNDLKGAIDYADDKNIGCLAAYIGYFYNNVPSLCWGSRENMLEWHDKTQEERTEILSLAEYNSLRDMA
jgi:hypothetical protein